MTRIAPSPHPFAEGAGLRRRISAWALALVLVTGCAIEYSNPYDTQALSWELQERDDSLFEMQRALAVFSPAPPPPLSPPEASEVESWRASVLASADANLLRDLLVENERKTAELTGRIERLEKLPDVLTGAQLVRLRRELRIETAKKPLIEERLQQIE